VSAPTSTKSVTRLFPFVLRSGILLVGRETLRRSKRKLHFVLLADDTSPAVRDEVLTDFASYPVVQHFTGAELAAFFGCAGAKVIGFAKSGLAQSIYAELKSHRLNPPAKPARPAAASPPQPEPENDARPTN